MTTTTTSTFERAVLGRTGREVLRIGVASSFGIGGADLERAVEEDGVAYLYWGSLRRPGFGRAIRSLVRRGLRDRLFIVIQSYTRLGSLMRPSLCIGLKRLGIEQADLLLLGMWNRGVPGRIRDAALSCRDRGLCRHIGVSTHTRTLVPDLAERSVYDVVHFRYNAAHRGAEREIFPLLSGGDRAGLVAFTATRWGQLLRAPGQDAGPLRPLTAAECYRFVLSCPDVDVCMTGPKNGDELRAAISALRQGPLDEEEMARVRAFGDAVYAS